MSKIRQQMPTYDQLSTQLYREQNFHSDVNFICCPEIILDSEKVNAVFLKVNEEISQTRNLTDFLNKIEASYNGLKYLFILSIALCIQRNGGEIIEDNGYWNMFSHYLGVEPNANNKSHILRMLKSFCKNHKIPFFDIYQNNSQINFVGRVYSLLPFTQNELYSLCFMAQKVGTVGYNDFSTLSEIALSGYEDIFQSTTIRVFEKLNDQIKICDTDFDNVTVTNWSEYFQSYFDRFSNNLDKLTIPDDITKELENTLSESGSSHFSLPDDLSFYFQSDQNNHIGRFLTQSKKSSIEIVNSVIPGNISRLSIAINVEGKLEKKTMEKGKFLVTSDPANGTWKEIRY